MAEKSPTKMYDVTEVTGVVQTIETTFMFNNAGELTFRLGERGDSEIVAVFPAGQWISCVKRKAQGDGRPLQS